jgi:iron complex transport system ATP-binding protein
VTPLLAVRDLSHRAHATTLLERIGFDVYPGDFVALTGRNGAGKSTLLDRLAGLRPVSAGRITLDGRPLHEWTPARRARLLAHLPQTTGDLPFRAEQVVLMGRYPHADAWFESDGDRAAARDAMRRTGCLAFAERPMATLSGGERQRVLLAACLAQQARLLLLDEPSTFLDVDQQLHCFALLREEADRGAACVAVTHDLNLALAFGTRLLVLDGGALVLDTDVASAAAAPEWLAVFSTRLALRAGPGGRPWVSYT